jgi:hypothetical protein
VQIITDVVQLSNVASQTQWQNHYRSRKGYGIEKSIKFRTTALNMINQIRVTINHFNQNHFLPGTVIPNAEHIIVPVDNRFGNILIHFIVNGPYTYSQRQLI